MARDYFDDEPAEPVLPASTSSAYHAWGQAAEGITMLELRQVPAAGLREQGEILPMNCLLRVIYTGSAQGELVTLVFTECLVKLKGRNLAGLRPLLMTGQVDFLQEFSSERWGEPRAGEGVIRSLQVEERQ